MERVIWEIGHSIHSETSLSFVWAYMTEVSHWDDPPATFHLDGPFLAGSHVTTRISGQESCRWQLLEVSPLKSYVLKMELDRADILFEWRFQSVVGGTRLTLHIVLKGQNAAAYVSQVQAAFSSTLAAGMDKMVSAMEHVAAAHSGRAQSAEL